MTRCFHRRWKVRTVGGASAAERSARIGTRRARRGATRLAEVAAAGSFFGAVPTAFAGDRGGWLVRS